MSDQFFKWGWLFYQIAAGGSMVVLTIVAIIYFPKLLVLLTEIVQLLRQLLALK